MLAWSPAIGHAKCEVARIAEFPISMAGRQPLIEVAINDNKERFILDSGAFYSTLSPSLARELKLHVDPAPSWFRVIGIGGDSSAGVTTVKLGIANASVPNVQFIVGGTETGYAGLLGQNVLGIGDAEYDFEHGKLSLYKSNGCGNIGMAYWAGGQPVTILPIEARDEQNHHTVGTVIVNGIKLRAIFDSGAGSTVISIKAAKRAGITPDSPGVRETGTGIGIGSHVARHWSVPIDSIDIGGEQLHHARISMEELFDNTDMLVGIDFFLTHRIFVANSQRRMYFTYDGGPLFGLNPRQAVTSEGQTVTLADNGKEPTDAVGFSDRGMALASKHDYIAALADLEKAVAMAPDNAHYLTQRAQIRVSLNQPQQSIGDVEKAIALVPGDTEARLFHAELALTLHQPDRAKSDITALETALAPVSDQRRLLAQLEDATGNLPAALNNYDQWLRYHPEDAHRAEAHGGRCRVRAELNRDLDKAIDDCNSAIRLDPHNVNYQDSRGLAHLRHGDTDAAITDFNAVLTANPNRPWTRYELGLAERAAGKTAQADKDLAAALAVNDKLADRSRKLGLESAAKP